MRSNERCDRARKTEFLTSQSHGSSIRSPAAPRLARSRPEIKVSTPDPSLLASRPAAAPPHPGFSPTKPPPLHKKTGSLVSRPPVAYTCRI